VLPRHELEAPLGDTTVGAMSVRGCTVDTARPGTPEPQMERETLLGPDQALLDVS
jgi:hypothetical protein